MRTRIKICGIASASAASEAVYAGADALGFNMYGSSARFIDPDETAVILGDVPPFVTTVGLFVNHSGDEVARIIEQCQFDLLQFHGDEDNDFCRSFGRPFIKAIRVGADTDVERVCGRFPDSKGILFDAMVRGKFGGTGTAFDWSLLTQIGKPVLLAGGLSADNVGDAIGTAGPYSVDVSSGVESSPGVKDAQLMLKFVRAVRTADEKKEV